MDKVSERPTRLESSAGSSNCPILRGLTLCSCIFTNVRPPLASDFTKIIDNILFSPPSSPLFFLSVYVVSFLSQIQLSLRTQIPSRLQIPSRTMANACMRVCFPHATHDRIEGAVPFFFRFPFSSSFAFEKQTKQKHKSHAYLFIYQCVDDDLL